MTLMASQIKCLIALGSLSQINREIASKDVAKLLGVSRPSIHKVLDILSREQLTEKAPYGAIHLTPTGRALAEAMTARQERLMVMFADHFGLALDEGSLAATQLMSTLSESSLERLEISAEFSWKQHKM